jgi:ABC-type sugar transport system permease subunit
MKETTNMFESIFDSTDGSGAAFSAQNLILALLVSLVLGLLISFCYMKTHKDNCPSQSFALTLVMLPAVITIIILLVGDNVARAFSLAGVFTIVRFRSAPGDPKDITYVLFTVAVGLASGMGYVTYAAIAAVLLCAVILLLWLCNFGKSKSMQKLLKITIPENLDYQTALDAVLKKHTSAYSLNRIKTTDLGSLFELQYTITAKTDMNEKVFIDELRCRNGNLNITLVMNAQTGEY